MRYVTCVLLLVVASDVQAADQKGSCGQALIAEVPLLVTPGHQVLVPANIGEKPVYLRLTMGSGLPLIEQSAARALGLASRPLSGSATFRNGQQRVDQFVSLQGLTIGAYRLATRAALVIPQPGEQDAVVIDGRTVAGVLGSDVFRNVDVEIRLAQQLLRLYRSVKCLRGSLVDWEAGSTTVPMRFDPAGTLVFNLSLNGRRVESTLLSGEAASALDVRVARDFLDMDASAPGTVPMSLSSDSLRLENIPVALRNGPDCKLIGQRPNSLAVAYDCINVVPFHLGLDVLSRLRVYLSTGREQLLLSPEP